MKNILLIEDDHAITNLLHLHLDSTVYNLASCTTGKEGIEKLALNNYSLIILDIMLPDINGMDLCKRIRKNFHTPVMMLTSLAAEADKVLALELGADDYITKPFGILELMARIKALIRRYAAASTEPANDVKNIQHKDIIIDPQKKRALLKNMRLDLTLKEFELLLLLATNPGKSFTRHELLEKVWGLAFKGYEHTVTAHINRLRIKIESDLDKPEYILTSWGVGYRFSE